MTHLFVGTTKGLFVLHSEDRITWNFSGPFCDGAPVNHVDADAISGQVWAVGGGDWDGAKVWCGDLSDGTWRATLLANGQMDEWLKNDPEFAEELGQAPNPDAPFKGQIDAMWSIKKVGGSLYAGTKPAMLLRSDDDGATWSKVSALTDQPGAENWNPGGAGLTLHTIVSDPSDADKIWVGISAAGVFATEDAGATWEQRIRRANDDDGTVGSCVHNMVRANEDADILYQQNHHGVFRSHDGGRSWVDITAGLPSSFGFPIAVHPTDSKKIWVLPLNGDSQGRYPPDASAAVWHSQDAGDSWVKQQSGLPAENCYFTVLRQAMSMDAETAPGLYFGTNSGSVFATLDEGKTWTEIASHLPTVLCVEAFTLG